MAEKAEGGWRQVEVGQSVPEWELEMFDPQKGDFGKLSLSEQKKKGKWTVLFFYPADYTFICPTELADAAEKWDELTKAGADLLSVSTDTKFVHLAWHREEKLLKNVRFPMGADPTGKLARMFGVYDEGTGLALRGTFIINPEGKLVGSETHFYNVGRNASEMLRKVKAFIYAAKHPEEVCPANWKEGEKTLKPGKDLVGRVSEAWEKQLAAR